MKKGLVVVDIQNDYFPGGRVELVEMEAAGKKAASSKTVGGWERHQVGTTSGS